MKDSILLSTTKVGRHTLRNRIVFRPLVRQRAAQPGNVPTDLMAKYHTQRASAGFLVSEGTLIEPRRPGYPIDEPAIGQPIAA